MVLWLHLWYLRNLNIDNFVTAYFLSHPKTFLESLIKSSRQSSRLSSMNLVIICSTACTIQTIMALWIKHEHIQIDIIVCMTYWTIYQNWQIVHRKSKDDFINITTCDRKPHYFQTRRYIRSYQPCCCTWVRACRASSWPGPAGPPPGRSSSGRTATTPPPPLRSTGLKRRYYVICIAHI